MNTSVVNLTDERKVPRDQWGFDMGVLRKSAYVQTMESDAGGGANIVNAGGW